MDFFVYGTLTTHDTAAELLDSFAYRGPAVLDGLHRVDGEYPTLLPGGQTTGRVLSTPETNTLDRYEGVDSGLYVRVSVPREDSEQIELYVGDPDRLGLSEDWPGSGPFEKRVHELLANHEVVVREQ